MYHTRMYGKRESVSMMSSHMHSSILDHDKAVFISFPSSQKQTLKNANASCKVYNIDIRVLRLSVLELLGIYCILYSKFPIAQVRIRDPVKLGLYTVTSTNATLIFAQRKPQKVTRAQGLKGAHLGTMFKD